MGNLDTGYVAVSQFWAPAVALYQTSNRQNDPPFCQINARDAEGMTTDVAGNLYAVVALQRYVGVAVFGPTCGTPGPTFEDRSGAPLVPAVDGNVLYLTNEVDNGSASATIEVYKVNGGPVAVRELYDPSVLEAFGLALDSRHNLFWATTNKWSMGGQVIEFHGGNQPGFVLRGTKVGTDLPGGVLLDRSNNLLLIDQTTRVVNVYRPPYADPPSRAIRLRGRAGFCALGPSQGRLFCLDYEVGAVDVYTYPAGKFEYAFTNGIDAKLGPIGIAIGKR